VKRRNRNPSNGTHASYTRPVCFFPFNICSPIGIGSNPDSTTPQSGHLCVSPSLSLPLQTLSFSSGSDPTTLPPFPSLLVRLSLQFNFLLFNCIISLLNLQQFYNNVLFYKFNFSCLGKLVFCRLKICNEPFKFLALNCRHTLVFFFLFLIYLFVP
jgi:hypothetical protein